VTASSSNYECATDAGAALLATCFLDCVLFGFFSDPEDGGILLRNVGSRSSDYSVEIYMGAEEKSFIAFLKKENP
jgi:hypothetical protein